MIATICSSENRPFRIAPSESGASLSTYRWSENPRAGQAKQEIEMEISALHAAVAGPISSFFRFPDLQHPPALLSYLAERNIAIFSTDIDSFDFKMRKTEQVIDSVIRKLGKQGKGIILMHDFQHPTAQALPELLRHLIKDTSPSATARPIPPEARVTIAVCSSPVFSSIIMRRRDVGPQRNAIAEARAISEVKDDHAEVLDTAGRSQQARIDALEADILRPRVLLVGTGENGSACRPSSACGSARKKSR
jgi:hypothetical protein